MRFRASVLVFGAMAASWVLSFCPQIMVSLALGGFFYNRRIWFVDKYIWLNKWG
jgi:hypothetical protein